MNEGNHDEGNGDRPGHLTRRRVLLATGGMLAAGGLAAGGFIYWRRHKRFLRKPQETIADHRVPWPTAAPKMVIARGPDPTHNVRGLLQRIGGLKQFVTPQDVVLIKPNIGWNRMPKHAANTDPHVVAELVRACQACRPKRIMVCDCPVDDSEATFKRSGILEQVPADGVEILRPEQSQFVGVRLSERLGTWDVLLPFVQATKIINVPVVKHHGDTAASAGMKNWIGLTTKERYSFHMDIHQSIAELALLMRPTLTILDASRVLMRNGPKGGSTADVKQLNTMATGLDPVALDAWACQQLLGLSVDKLPKHLHLGQEKGLGEIDFKRLDPIEIKTV